MVVEAIKRISNILKEHLDVELVAIETDEKLDIDPELTIEFSDAAAHEIKGVRLSRRPAGLPDRELALFKDFVGSFLDGIVEGVHRLSDLDQVNDHLERLVARDEAENSGQVLNINHYRTNRFPFKWGQEVDDEDETMASRACLFVGPSPEMNFRAAFDMHAGSGRFAFVNLTDLSPDVWDDVVAVRRLGNLSIFVPEITQLSMREQDNMLAILLGEGSDEDPWFAFASRLNVPEMRRSGILHPDLIDLLEPTHQRVRTNVSASSQTDQFLSP